MSDRPRIEGDRNRHEYRCGCGGTEFVLTLAVGDRKLKRYAKCCKKLIWPIKTTRIRETTKELKSRELPPLW